MDGSQLAAAPLEAQIAAVGEQTAGRVRWRVAPEWAALLIGPHGLRLDEWLSDGRVQIVKHASHRTVYRVDLPERTFYLKHYRVLSFLNAATHLLRGSAARREWRNALEVHRRNVPTVSPIALGEHHRGGLVRDSYFVSEAIPDSCTVERYADEYLPKLPPREQAIMRRRITCAMAHLCAAAHRGGVYHTDFHRGNVLVSLPTLGDAAAPRAELPALHLIDLPKVWFSRPLSWERSRDSLAMFAAAWLDRSTRTERWRFWKAYLAERPELALAEPVAGANEIVRRSRAHAQRIFRDRDKRALRTNRDYYRVKRPAGVGYAVSGLARSDFFAIVDDPARALIAHGVEVIKESLDSSVVKTEFTIDGHAKAAAFKRACYRSWRKALLGLVRRSRSLRAWHLGHALRERGIEAARPLCVCEPRTSRLPWQSYLATEWIDGDHLRDYLNRLFTAPDEERREKGRRCAVVLGRLIGRMHAWNIGHRDLKAANLMLAEQNAQLRAYLIDLDGVRLVRRLSERRRARNLARLATSMEAHPFVTRTDRLRFLRAYLAVAPLEHHSWKWFWRGAARRSRKLTRQMRASGREVL